jgi:hypothetical protein
MYCEFESVHDTYEIYVDNVHTGFRWLCERIWWRLYQSVHSRRANLRLSLVDTAPSKGIRGSPDPLPTPAFAMTMSTVLLGDIEIAVSKRRTWPSHDLVSHLTNTAFALSCW